MKKENFKSIGICFSCRVRKQKNKDVMVWDTRARVDKAFMLYKLGYIDAILCTGGIFQEGQRIPIAKLMKEYLAKRGIPQNDILTEIKSVETVENIKFSFFILEQRGFFKNIKNTEQLRLIFISEPNHLRRIKVIARAYLMKYKIDSVVPLLFEPVSYNISDKIKQKEDEILRQTKVDPLGEGEIFEKDRKEKR